MNTDSISDWFCTNRLLFVNAKNNNDLFSGTEEVLRSGISKIVIIEIPGIPNSLQMYRINLAMTLGMKSNYTILPLGLILSPNNGGATSIESRWYASTLHWWKNLTDRRDGSSKQKRYIRRLFSRTEPVKKWSIETRTCFEENTPPQLLSLPII